MIQLYQNIEIITFFTLIIFSSGINTRGTNHRVNRQPKIVDLWVLHKVLAFETKLTKTKAFQGLYLPIWGKVLSTHCYCQKEHQYISHITLASFPGVKNKRAEE